MKRVVGFLILIFSISLSMQPAQAQQVSTAVEHWHTAGAGLSTPLGFNLGTSHSLVVKGPLFAQLNASASKDIYVTKHSAYALGAAVGLRHYNEVALTSISVGPTYLSGTRGADLGAPGNAYETVSMTVTAQMLLRDVNMGFEFYTNFNPVRNVSGMRLIFRMGKMR